MDSSRRVPEVTPRGYSILHIHCEQLLMRRLKGEGGEEREFSLLPPLLDLEFLIEEKYSENKRWLVKLAIGVLLLICLIA